MANVVKSSYKHANYDKLLKELNKAAGSVQPAPQLETPAATAADNAASLKRNRRQMLRNPDNKFVFSTGHKLLHDRDCKHVSDINDENFQMLTKFPGDMKCCPDCYRRALVRAGLEPGAACQMNTYENTLLRLGIQNKDLRRLTVENGAKLCGVGVNTLRFQVHEDTWEICKDGETWLLYHNNYEIAEDYKRYFGDGFHLQRNSVGDSSFYYFSNIMCSYSWAEHVQLLKEQEAERQRQQRKEFLAQVHNFEKINRLSILFDVFICLDCNGKLPRFLHRNKVFAKELAYESRMKTHALRQLRVLRFHRRRFCKAMEDLKIYSIESFPEYGPECVKRIQQTGRDTNERNHYAAC